MISIIKNQWRKFIHYYKQQGFMWSVYHMISDAINYQKWLIVAMEVYDIKEDVLTKIPVSIRFLSKSEDDIERLVSFWPDVYTPLFSTPQTITHLIHERLDRGEVCLIAEYNGEIIYMAWIGHYSTHINRGYETKRGLNHGEAIGYDLYCSERYRNMNVMKKARTEVIKYLYIHDYKRLINYILPTNAPSLKVAKRYGGYLEGSVRIISIFSARVSILRKSQNIFRLRSDN